MTAASDTLEKNRQFLQTQIKNVVDDPENKAAVDALKKQLRLEYIQVRVLLATATESHCRPFPNPSVQRKNQLGKALTQHEENWEKYRTFTQGLNAALGAARCAQGIGDEVKALTYCNEIFESGRHRWLYSAEKTSRDDCKKIWVKKNPLPFADIIKTLEPLINGLTTREKRQADWLDLQLLLQKTPSPGKVL